MSAAQEWLLAQALPALRSPLLSRLLLAPAAFGLLLTLGALALARLGGEALRRRISLGPMGLVREPARRRPRNVLDTQPHASWQQWARSLGRSQRSTLLGQVDRAAQRGGIVLRTAGPAHAALLSLAHVRVAVAHQLRVALYRPQQPPQPLWAALRSWLGLALFVPLAVVRGWFRWLVAAIMVGEVDEWRCEADGRLLAWSVTIVKGDTLRGMWFYTSEAHAMIYFAALRLNVARALAMDGVRWVDAGPSRGAAGKRAATVKAAFGFDEVGVWGRPGEPCSYEGDFVRAMPAEEALQLPR